MGVYGLTYSLYHPTGDNVEGTGVHVIHVLRNWKNRMWKSVRTAVLVNLGLAGMRNG